MINISDDPLPRLTPRQATSHKGDHGRVLAVGGSLGMAGAPAMVGMAALRSGAGLVSVATSRCVQATTAGFCSAYTTHGLADDGERLDTRAEPALADLLEDADAAAIGPGLGRGEGVTELVRSAWSTAVPMVFDADALNALATQRASLTTPPAPRVLTPHAGEFARISGRPLNDPDDAEERRVRAAALVEEIGGETVVLLKGHRTVVTDGRRFAVNATGNPGMATGGSGDVLTGVVLALLGQGLSAMEAARLGAHVHGLAGDLAAAELGQVGMIATDLIDCLPNAWAKLG